MSLYLTQRLSDGPSALRAPIGALGSLFTLPAASANQQNFPLLDSHDLRIRWYRLYLTECIYFLKSSPGLSGNQRSLANKSTDTVHETQNLLPEYERTET